MVRPFIQLCKIITPQKIKIWHAVTIAIKSITILSIVNLPLLQRLNAKEVRGCSSRFFAVFGLGIGYFAAGTIAPLLSGP
jgi:hypothetical protein